MKIIFLIAGFVILAIGVIGIFLPLLPTTPFVILAAYCFAQSSPRFHNWLITHSFFGPMVLNWQERRAIPQKAKYLAFTMMTLSCAMVWYRLLDTSWFILAPISSILCLGVMIWMWRLPSS
ncbi:MAG: YbaN family protein [Gammaproteobacteria bacterium]|nr:YbaN family protein [Gammaproteobacteria bacterium]